MEDFISQCHAVAKGAWKYRFLAIASAWAVMLADSMMVLSMPTQFKASARVFVDTESILRPILSGMAKVPNTEQQVSIVSRTLITRPNVEKVICLRKLGMVTPDGPRSAMAEEFRAIKRPLIEQRHDSPNGNLIMVSSALPGEGKTCCPINLAMSIAMEVDHTVLLLDADATRPSAPDRLGNFDDMHDTRATGLQALWRMKLNARTQSTINAGTERVSMAAIGRTDRHQWSRQLRGSVELRHARQSSNLIPGSARENALAFTLSALL